MPQRPEPRATTESAQGLAAMLFASHLPMTSAPATCELPAGLAAQGRGWKAIGSSGRASLRASTTASGYLTSGWPRPAGPIVHSGTLTRTDRGWTAALVICPTLTIATADPGEETLTDCAETTDATKIPTR